MSIHRFKRLLLLSLTLLILSACRPASNPAPTPTILPTPTTETKTSAPAGSYAGRFVGQPDAAMEIDMYAVDAPAFPTNVEWLNTDRPLTMAELRGKIVILDFWTYGCINCQQNFPDLKRLQADYPDEVVVIGIHSAKFTTEQETENIRQTILRHNLTHPVINDRDLDIWYDWGVQAWPTIILVDPVGQIFGFHIGENLYQAFKPAIQSLVNAYDERIDRTPLTLKRERDGLPQTVLSFPAKVLVDDASDRLFIADTNHNRIVIADQNDGQVLDLIGSGQPGFADGERRSAAFNKPHGLALSPDGQTLYVADTGNHALRRIDLPPGTVETLAGNGVQNRDLPPQGGPARAVSLASPWDLLLAGDRLYVAMAGAHQLWQLDMQTDTIQPLAGNALEGNKDGSLTEAELAQPSGLARDERGRLYIADAESSTIRRIEIDPSPGRVAVLAGGYQLFDFGDVDGAAREARFQHPLGITYYDGFLYLADTYNHKLKRIDPDTGRADTIFGSGRGWRDGPDPLFYEPGGLAAAAGKLYVADTNNHAVRVVDLAAGTVNTLVLKGIDRFTPGPDDDHFRGKVVALPRQAVGAGNGRVRLNVVLPAGYKVNEDAPYSMRWSVEGSVLVLAPEANRSILAPQFPLELAATFSPGQGTLTGDLAIYYCQAETERICLLEQVRLVAPLAVEAGKPPDLSLEYRITLPDLGPET